LSLLETVAHTALVVWVAESDYGYPIVLTAHAIGMALVVGIALIFDLRVLGYARRMPLAVFDELFRVAWLGFAVNLVSGTLLFLANYTAFIHNTAFITKIILLIAAGIATWLLARAVDIEGAVAGRAELATTRGKVIAAVCLVLWLGAITAGRIVGYTSVPE
jgi:hypothetical protein